MKYDYDVLFRMLEGRAFAEGEESEGILYRLKLMKEIVAARIGMPLVSGELDLFVFLARVVERVGDLNDSALQLQSNYSEARAITLRYEFCCLAALCLEALELL